MDLNKLRKKISAVDDELLDLFAQRMALSDQIADCKKKDHRPVRDKKREEELLEKIPRAHPYRPYLEEFYKDMMAISVEYQNERRKGDRFGLLGRGLGHSFSKEIHEDYLNTPYEYFDVPENRIESFLKDPTIRGFNVTHPYKETVMKYLDGISEEAEAIGCVNTVIRRKGKLYGYNTDIDGFLYGLKRAKIDVKKKNVVILGNGATSKTVYRALRKKGAAKIVKLTRNSRIKYKDAPKYHYFDLVINTTPVGMYPNNGKSLIDLDLFDNLDAVVDVIYNPRRTELMLDAKERGIKTLGGLPMLTAQAVSASKLFKGTSGVSVDRIYKDLVCSMENLVIVGMPGSGKSSLARKIAKKMNRPYIDTDRKIRDKYGPINNIILHEGEKAFRRKEKEIIEEVGKATGAVIATGGGSVLTPENYRPLKQNGTVFFIKRNIKYLSKRNRPISQRSNLHEMYKKRKPLYEDFADITMTNRSFRRCVDDMIGAFYETVCD